MPVKILLADKSITIQKVVEMLFSGKEYAVMAVSDGESAVGEAARVVPDVVLADVDLPRMDGYTLSTRLHQNPQLARTPVILMLSRDDVYDDVIGKQAGIIDHIAKPFESQDLIGKVKRALTAVPAGAAAAPLPRPAAATPPPISPSKPKAAIPSNIFDIIQEAPSRTEIKQTAALPPEESVYEVEPEIEMEEPIAAEIVEALPFGEKARDEMREGLGIGMEAVTGGSIFGEFTAEPEIQEPPPRPASPPQRAAAPRAAKPAGPSAVSEEMLRAVAEETVARIAREVLERIAWEVVPQLAETLIREEIERLKAETR